MAIDPYGRLAFGHLLQLHKELVLSYFVVEQDFSQIFHSTLYLGSVKCTLSFSKKLENYICLVFYSSL